MPVKGFVTITVSEKLASEIDSMKDDDAKTRPAVIARCIAKCKKR